MKALILLSIIVMSSCSSTTFVYSCGDGTDAVGYEVLTIAEPNSGQGVVNKINLIEDQCARLYYEQTLQAGDIVNLKKSAPLRKN